MSKYNRVYSRPIALNMVEENGKVWMALANRNGICEVNLETKKAKIIKTFSNESLAHEILYNCIEKINNYLVFAPGLAKKIAIYNLEDNSLIYIPLKKMEDEYKENQNESKFWNIIRHDSSVYLLGYSYPAIIKINMISMEVSYITDWVEEAENNINIGDDSGYFSDGHIIIGNSILIPMGCMKAILELDLKTSQTKIRKLNVTMEGIGGLSSIDKENIWLVGRKNKTNWISCWNIKTNKIKEIPFKEMNDNIFDPFYAPICTPSKVFLFPISSSYIYEIDINNLNIKKSKICREERYIPSLWPRWKTAAPRFLGNHLKFLSCTDLCWYEYDIFTEEIKKYFIDIEEDGMEKYFDAMYLNMEGKNTILSERILPLKYFINRPLNSNEKMIRNKEYQIGKRIYDNF